MKREILDRIRREITITVAGARETLLTIAERVNRKTQAIKLHWHAAELTRQIALAHQEIGALVTGALMGRDQNLASQDPSPELHGRLEELAATLRILKLELGRIDRRIEEIEADTLSDDMVRFQLDLSGRSLHVERLTVVPEATAVGVPIDKLTLSSDTRVMAVFRGPALLGERVSNGVRAGDIVILVGTRTDLMRDRLRFTQRHRASA